MSSSRIRITLAALTAALLAAIVLAAPSLGAFGDTPPVVTKLKVKPSAFKALAKGGAVATKGGAVVSFTLSDHSTLKVTYRKATQTGYKAVPGAFQFIGLPGDNDFRISGRAGMTKLKALAPGRYRVVLTPVASGGRSAYAPFKIVR